MPRIYAAHYLFIGWNLNSLIAMLAARNVSCKTKRMMTLFAALDNISHNSERIDRQKLNKLSPPRSSKGRRFHFILEESRTALIKTTRTRENFNRNTHESTGYLLIPVLITLINFFLNVINED